jgi:hypothetical protein
MRKNNGKDVSIVTIDLDTMQWHGDKVDIVKKLMEDHFYNPYNKNDVLRLPEIIGMIAGYLFYAVTE